MFFLASSHTKNTKSEKTNKHTIWLIYPKKRFEHMLFSKVIIIAFAHKKKFLKKTHELSHEVNQSQEELSIGEQSILLYVL